MFWKKKLPKSQAGQNLLHYSWNLQIENQVTFDEIIDCGNLSRGHQLRCRWETTYLLISLMYLWILTFLPGKGNESYEQAPFIDIKKIT